ncbi:hypothetical protein [Pseudokineococcus sp. 1T1Z-3]|uniref:hypothetical protein n=1 Tax=Pseudokineococcus sp. 1T1Z-3 TaxID=3132745 RepID=UPI0030A03649
MTLLVALSGCAAPGAHDDQTASDARPTAAQGSTTPATGAAPSSGAAASSAPTTASDEDRVAAFCEANAAAAAAVRGTVAEDITARQAQGDAARELPPVPGGSPQVEAGAEKFAAAADETVDILRTFPPEALVSDVGTDPRFLESTAVQAAADDPEYQAFLLWTMQTCSTTP